MNLANQDEALQIKIPHVVLPWRVVLQRQVPLYICPIDAFLGDNPLGEGHMVVDEVVVTQKKVECISMAALPLKYKGLTISISVQENHVMS